MARPVVRTLDLGGRGFAVDAELTLDRRAIEKMLRGRGGEVNRMMSGFAGIATKSVRQVADQRVKTRTGRYKRGIRATLTAPDQLMVEATAPYSAVLELGSRRHPIVARRARFLRFEIDGVVYFRRRVNHPGTRAYHILRDGTYQAGRRLNLLARR